MNKIAFALSLSAILPLSAQTWDVTVFAGQQSYRSAAAGSAATGLTESFSTPSKNVTALRLGWEAMDLEPATLEVSAAYQPMTASTQTSYLYQDYPTTAYQSYAYKTGYAAVGAMVRFKLLLDLGLGLDVRFEQLSAQGFSTTLDRPWARATFGWSFPLSAVTPTFGAEAAYPLTSKSLELLGSSANTLQATAPKSQLGLYAGVRF